MAPAGASTAVEPSGSLLASVAEEERDEDPHLQSKQALVSFLSMRGLQPTDEQMARIEHGVLPTSRLLPACSVGERRCGAHRRRWTRTSASARARVILACSVLS